VDLLEKLIRHLDNKKFGFVIIGDGPSKPDFSIYTNVYDFGAVYDRSLKNELFTVADLYFQPGWVGLSIVEAMAYGKPILTYSRSEEILQCVEYSYIKNGQNGLLFSSYENSVSVIQNLSPTETLKMGERARMFVRENLMMSMMISNAVNTLKS
jgi:glycosyltransferase involved in cell wall biosynthesis